MLREKGRSLLLGACVVLVLGGGLAFALVEAQRLPSGPVEVAWDREACAHCRMHVGEPSFAAQLQTRDGQVLSFDDPGCLLRYLAERSPDAHAIYVHEVRGARWIPLESAGFLPVSPTPMGFGIGAVEKGTPGAISLEEARARVLAPSRGGARAGE